MNGSEHFAHGFVDGKTPEEIVVPGAVVRIRTVNWPTPDVDPHWRKPDSLFTSESRDDAAKPE